MTAPSSLGRVGIVGAGLAGLTAAEELHAAGVRVVVWEKSRGAGGRTATRRGPGGARFDHGAPVLHDGDRPLEGLPAAAAHGLVLPDGSTHRVTVGAPSGNAPAKALAECGVELRAGVRVGTTAAEGDGWRVRGDDDADLGRFDAVIVTAPAPQAVELLRAPAPELAERAASVAFDPCWAVMVGWEGPLDLPFDAFRAMGPLAWAVAEATKPGRDPGERWVLQATADWSRERLENEPDVIAERLLAVFGGLVGTSLPRPSHLAAHRWRFARPATPLRETLLRSGTLLAAGDWCGGTSAGDAVRSGRAAARALLGADPGPG